MINGWSDINFVRPPQHNSLGCIIIGMTFRNGDLPSTNQQFSMMSSASHVLHFLLIDHLISRWDGLKFHDHNRWYPCECRLVRSFSRQSSWLPDDRLKNKVACQIFFSRNEPPSFAPLISYFHHITVADQYWLRPYLLKDKSHTQFQNQPLP